MYFLWFKVFLSFVPEIETCKMYTYVWQHCGPCSLSCGGGTRKRHGESCFWGIDTTGTGKSGENCYYNNPYYSDSCHCSSWTGRCCEIHVIPKCRQIYIPHCKYERQQCGGSPDNIQCTSCDKPYYSGGYGKGCLDHGLTIVLPVIVAAIVIIVIGIVVKRRRKIKDEEPSADDSTEYCDLSVVTNPSIYDTVNNVPEQVTDVETNVIYDNIRIYNNECDYYNLNPTDNRDV